MRIPSHPLASAILFGLMVSATMPADSAASPQSSAAPAFSQAAVTAYSIDPKSVAANTAFDLFLAVPSAYCGSRFTHLAVTVDGAAIKLIYEDTTGLAALCVPGNRDYGPTYHLQPLKAGVYQVSVMHLLACESNPCVARDVIPEPAGTLTVGGTASLSGNSRAHGEGNAAADTRMIGGKVETPWSNGPEGHWRYDLQGRRLIGANL